MEIPDAALEISLEKLEHWERALASAQPGSELARSIEANIAQALQQVGGNKAKAARLLGISRATIYNKIKAYNITA